MTGNAFTAARDDFDISGVAPLANPERPMGIHRPDV